MINGGILPEKLKFHRLYYLLLLTTLVFFILLITFPGIIQTVIGLTIILSAYILLIIKVVSGIRKQELSEIIGAIRQIRGESSAGSEKIKLSPGIRELETELSLMKQRIDQDIEYLKKLERVRTEFLGNVSHELKTPIFAIQGYVETLINGALNDKKVNKYFLEKALHHINNLNHLVSDLIDISMIESGEMRLSFRYFDAGDYLTSIINDFRQFAHEKGLEIEFIHTGKPIQLFGDKAKLKQVLSNLINNALKYTESGYVRISLTDEGKTATISVEDSGIGIPEDDLDRIFERFYRVDKDRSREVGGTGLGLAIVKHIVEAHGSRISVESTPGKGSRFLFSLRK